MNLEEEEYNSFNIGWRNYPNQGKSYFRKYSWFAIANKVIVIDHRALKHCTHKNYVYVAKYIYSVHGSAFICSGIRDFNVQFIKW